MEQETRNKLQRATQQIRRLLEEEFAEQLEGTFDILASGKILPSAGKHLDARQRLTRQKLVDAIEHIKAGGKKPQEAVEEYTREAAFTFLNRFVALRMLEARGLLQECVSKGDQSSGFKEFIGLAPGLVSLPDGGYRLYLECLFDELSVEVKVLFDRRDSASLLWPRRGALTGLLDILSQTDLAGVWGEDETIGWVYQYFNSGEERKKMRDESQAPRNSRELAVRNQFFTPRYVVEFLTDNTLGRIWYEMRKGQTRLIDECCYLVRRPSEVFLSEGQEPPADKDDAETNFSQEQLLKATVYIPHRAKKDPRDLNILDPACGSGHFLLYAFDLLIWIYEEAWHDVGSPRSDVTGNTLKSDYPELQQLHAAVPGLILAHNLHGIDIDPRAAQIAALALWMRGQRVFFEFGIARSSRPALAKSNIVCAEPMPGELVFLDEFIQKQLSETPEGRFLASLVRKVFESMKLAGEAGSLLKIEEDIAEEVAKAKKQWLERPAMKQKMLFSDNATMVQKDLDLTRGITDASFWEEAEQRIYESLRTYSEHVEKAGGFQRRLFAADAARGFAFIDLFRQRYDVTLMNPPFGEAALSSRTYLYQAIPVSSRDLFAAFVERFSSLLAHGGRLGAITSRTAFFNDYLATWRRNVFLGKTASLICAADLGYGVLDAVVETAAYVCERVAASLSTVIGALDTVEKSRRLATAVRDCCQGTQSEYCYDRHTSTFENIPSCRIAYQVPSGWTSILKPASSHKLFQAKRGVDSGDDFRFFRSWWETPPGDPNWKWLAKGGSFSRYTTSTHLKVNWAFRLFLRRTQNSDLYGKCGATFTRRTTSNLSCRVLNSESFFADLGPAIVPINPTHASFILMLGNSVVATYAIEIMVGGGDYSVRGSAARTLEPTYLEHLVDVDLTDPEVAYFDEIVQDLITCLAPFSYDETHPLFRGIQLAGHSTIRDAAETLWRKGFEALAHCYEIVDCCERRIASKFGLTSDDVQAVSGDTGWPWPDSPHLDAVKREWLDGIDLHPRDEGSGRIHGLELGERFQSKLSHYLHHDIEAVAHSSKVSPSELCRYLSACHCVSDSFVFGFVKSTLSLLIGMCFGRWTPTQKCLVTGSVFAPLPDVQMAVTGIDGKIVGHSILVDDHGHPHDLITILRKALEELARTDVDTRFQELASFFTTSVAGHSGMRSWLARSFFSEHVSLYSKSRRKAPIYWQLGTPSASYSAWAYYHTLTRDTLFQLLNEYVKPKRNHEQQKLERLKREASPEPTRSQRKDIEDQEKFVAEMASMSEEVERIAPLWNPNLSDGVIINFAPIWRLVPQNKTWQKECKECWEQLVSGEYDWAHLAMHLWPERVVPKCVNDASLAIAHGIEQIFWDRDDRERIQPKAKPEGGWQSVIDQLVKERTSPAVKAALKSLLEAPVSGAPTRKSRSRRGTAL